MSEITLSEVRKVYNGETVAVEGESLTIQDGEFVTLVGPSGCGKTTTLRMLAGFVKPTSGRISIGETDVTSLPPYRRDIGMVFQHFALFPHLTVGENVAYGLRSSGEYTDEEIETRVREMLALVQLPDTGHRKPDELSGGQQQRIALARALAPEPEVLLLDEPLASLDKKLREQMQKELKEIQDRVGITTLFVTHNQTEAMAMSDRLVVMNDGEFEQIGAPTEVYDNPTSEFVADFLGTSNIFEGTTTFDDPDTVVAEDIELRVGSRPTTERSTVVVRPEDVRIAPPDGEHNGANVISGTVDFKRNLGNAVQYHVKTDAGREMLALSQRRDSVFDERARVDLLVDPDDCLLIPG